MRKLSRLVGCSILLMAGATTAWAAPSFIEHEFRYEAGRFSITEKDGETLVRMSGASPEFLSGRPDLPMLGEPVELPAGVRVVGVDVIGLDTEMLKNKARVPSAYRPMPGLGPLARTEPDPAFYGRSGFPAASATAVLGYEGWMRGRHLAWLQVSPVRWDAASGRLERVKRLRVRIRLEPHVDADVVRRERIVPEWEDARTFPGSPRAGLARGGRTAQPFSPTQVPSVLGSPVAYVIVTTDPMASEFQRLADWKTQSGVPTVVRTLSFIRAQYPFGTDDADRVRQFLRDAYSRWGTKWVLLGGDTEHIPFRMIYTTFYLGENIPCDMYFSCLDGTWNADGDSTYGEGYYNVASPGDACDLMPDVHVGRAPVANAADANEFVDKNFMYTRTPVGDYEHMIMFFAEVLFPQDWSPGQYTALDGAELAEEVLPSVQTIPGLHYLRLYQNYTDARWEPGALLETKQTVVDSMDVGYNMSIHVGHGYRNVMSVGDATLGNSDATGMTNGNRLTNLYAINCTSNAIDYPCIGEAYMLAPNGGAVTNIGSTRFDFPHSGRAFQKEYFRLLFEDSVTAVGEAQTLQKLPFTATSVQDNINRWTATTLLMLGDPELRQWLGKPRTLTVVHAPSYALSDTTLLVNVAITGVPLYGARVTLHKAGDDYRSVTTDGAGNALVDFRPGTTGSLVVTVTGFDCRPYQATIAVTASATPVLADGTPVVDDLDNDGAGGKVGDNDGVLDAGETVDLTIPLTNNGTGSATSVNAVITTTDGMVTIDDSDVFYDTIAATATAPGTTRYRISLPATCPDQREIPFTLSIVDGAARHYVQRLNITAHAPETRHFSHVISDLSGNGNGVPENGETINFFVKLRNLGSANANAVTAVLRNYDGMATISDTTAVFGAIPAGQEVQGDAFTYLVGNTAAKLELRVSDVYGLRWTQMIDLVRPAVPVQLLAVGSHSSISLTWARSAAPDLIGYNVFRSSTGAGGPYTKVNTVPTDRSSYYQDAGLASMTVYHYRVGAVDSSGNETGGSAIASTSTNPPFHDLFPIEMRRTTPASIAVDYVYQASMMDIAAGADVIWLWHADGTAPIDADQSEVSYGDFTTLGTYYAAGPSLARLDGGNWSIIGGSWKNTAPESMLVYVFDKQGNVRSGWPFRAAEGIWSGITVGDLNNDGSSELVFGSNNGRIYALRSDGTEWIDGDSNPTTLGVFKTMPTCCNFGTAALAPLEAASPNQLDIIFAGFDGGLYAWRPDGSNVPGFPVALGGTTSSSVAVGYLDGTGDTALEIVVAGQDDSLYVIKPDGGRRIGFPVYMKVSGTSKNPSPALANMDMDLAGTLEIVGAGTDGKIYVFDRNGVAVPAFASSRFSSLTSFATESSPVVADINGDGLPDIVMGDENGVLNGISGTGAPLPGFPIQLGGEVRGVPALCDCDHDGLSEIVVSSWDQNTYMWDYDFPFSPAGTPPWPQFHHDARRTGLASSQTFVDVPTPQPLAPPVQVELAMPSPNPAQLSSRIAWSVPAEHAGADFDLAIYDLVGRRVATLASGSAEAGRFSVDWNLRSADGRVGGGIYFLRFRLGATVTGRKLVVMP